MGPARNETQIAYHRRRAQELKLSRSPWESAWQGLADFIEPTRLRMSNKPEGHTSRKKIIDSSGTLALRTLASGMHSGLTSPARPWFRLGTFDPDLKDYAPVKEYLALVERRMREVFQGSNLYTSFHTGYGDLGQFGQWLGIMAGDSQDLIRMQNVMHGRFWLARDSKGRVTTMYRTFRWSVQRIVEKFGLERVPQQVRQAYDTACYDQTYDVWHAIEPRMNRDPGPDRIEARNKPWLSNYWMDEGREQSGLLQESGFDENPLISPPWDLPGEDHYAVSPGMIALGDVQMLQKEQSEKLRAIALLTKPPMTGPSSMKSNPASLLPGSLTFVDDPTGKGYRPAMEVHLRLNELAADIRETQGRIRETFYADLFLMISQMEGIQPRNDLEIAERKEEKLLALGPVLENIYNAQLEPVITRTYAILNRRGELPPPPPEIEDKDIRIEYISMLAQAQKAVSTGAVERGVGFVGQLASVKPEVLDKFDADEAVDQYFDMLGVPPSIVVPDDDVADIRQAREQARQAAAAAELASKAAPAAKQGAEAAQVLASAGDNPAGGDLLRQLGIG